MAQQPAHVETIRAVDGFVKSVADFDHVQTQGVNAWSGWYAKLGTSIALIAAGDTVVYAHAIYRYPETTATLIVFTEKSVIIHSTDDVEAKTPPVVTVVARNSLTNFTLSSSEGLTKGDAHPHTWPGRLELSLTYPALADPIQVSADGWTPEVSDEPSALAKLVKSLGEDLAS
ncbi:hypothetical protein [Microbacterium sp. NPDC086615]|uniref:hypothetical protein n=1 Tax=Microbacterium sp. NPDC086615 TaxID=3154865 RepID=UPI00341852A9